ncbi:MAG: aminopeptidase P N-terminal domain-containing protein [Longimicrobiales bacterium]
MTVGGFLLLTLLLPPRGVAQVGSPAGPVPPELLEARRGRFLEALNGAPAIVTSSRVRDMDREYPQDSDYRESNDFFYLTGIEAPGGWLVVNGGGEATVVLFLPRRSPEREAWTGVRLGPGPEARALTGLEDVRSLEELGGTLEGWFGGKSEGGGGPLYLSLGDPEQRAALDSLMGSSGLEQLDAGALLGSLRLVKDEEELRRLKRAVDITMEAHREVWRAAEPGIAEYQLEAALEYVFRTQGAERVGFPSIVASGSNSTILHYDRNRRVLEAGDLVVVDIGAEFGYLTADITRTFPASGTFSPRQKALYSLVLGARDAAVAAVRPGITTSDLGRVARDYFQEHSGDLCGQESCLRFFTHGLSHWLGMDVHDVGSRSAPLAPGMVLTIEPGLYLPAEGVGIRIEDDVLVTETGFEVLTDALPRTAEEIEAAMRETPLWVVPPTSGEE